MEIALILLVAVILFFVVREQTNQASKVHHE